MACENDWTIRFLGTNEEQDAGPFEVRPISMNLSLPESRYDFCRATLPWEVGEEMKSHTRYPEGELYGWTVTEVCYNGEPIRQLLFQPDFVDYGDQTHIQLHDLQKSFSDGSIDEQRDIIGLSEAYELVLDSVENDIVDTVKFSNLPTDQIRQVFGEPNGLAYQIGTATGVIRPERVGMYEGEVSRMVDSNNGIDFENITPEEAFQRLNSKFRLRSWVNKDRELIVGIPEDNWIRHIAAPRDPRVWSYKDPQISHETEPVKMAIVQGQWIDGPGIDHNPVDWFTTGGGDVRQMGVAVRSDVNDGRNVFVKANNAGKEALPEIAMLVLKQEIQSSNAGTITINPENSGTDFSHPVDLMPGDLLHIVPDDSAFFNPDATSGTIGNGPDKPGEVCGNIVNNEIYRVSEVEHNITKQGHWEVHVDIGMVPDIEAEAYMDIFDPADGDWGRGDRGDWFE